MAVPFAPPVPVRELNLLRHPLRFESKAAAAFREEAATAFFKLTGIDHTPETRISNS